VGILMIAGTVWSFHGVGNGLADDLSVRQLVLSWFVPSAPALIRALRESRAHGEIASEKERLFEAVRSQLESPTVDEPSEEQLASSRLRLDASRIISLFFVFEPNGCQRVSTIGTRSQTNRTSLVRLMIFAANY
jgi:hypothetical protein